jgi:hypothetical protein
MSLEYNSSPLERPETVTRLKNIYQDNPIAKLILDYFAACDRNVDVITADELEDTFKARNIDIVRQNTLSVFKFLETLDLGVCKAGRKGYPTRFESERYYLVEIGEKAKDNQVLDESQEEHELDTQTAQECNGENLEDKRDLLNNRDVSNNLFKYSFQLRPDLMISLEFPVDLTNSEAERLSNFIKILPFKG